MDLTKGEPLKVILLFSLPLLLGNLFQQFYNLTDTAIIGHALGDNALASIGSVSILFNIFMSLVFGMSSGFSVIISNNFGANDIKRLKSAVANSLYLGFFIAFMIAGLGSLFLNPLMRFLEVPNNLYSDAYKYIIIVIATLPIAMAYNALASFLRAIGEALAPLIILVISAVLNVILDILFVFVFGFGIVGAAVATVIAQVISAIACYVYIRINVPLLHLSHENLKVDFNLIRNLFASGISFALMFTIVHIGSFFLQQAINGLGDDVIAAHTTARKIDSFYMMPTTTISSAMATFSGQNHGAKQHSRIIEGLKKSMLAACVINTFLIISIFVFGNQISFAISGSENATIIGLCTKYLQWNIPFFFVLAVLCIARTTLQGVGSKIAPLICSLMEMGIKIIIAKAFVNSFGYNGIIISEPITWIVCAIFIMIVFFTNKNIKSAYKSKKSA
ncbi:MAG: MATE family efflux transporter [Clostridia bacterium]|nr:MATE family efflux transporter [Clostridia bacterium]